MAKKMSEEEIREVATKRVRAKKGFYSHLTVYIIVNLMLVAIWFFTGAGYFWPMWVLLFWGIGLVFNAVAVFFKHDINWETKEIEKEIEKIKQSGS